MCRLVWKRKLVETTTLRKNKKSKLHPERVTVAESEPLLPQEVMSKCPLVLPQQKFDEASIEESLPACGEVNGVLPSCMVDPVRGYSDDSRRLQLKMRMHGSNWDITVISKVGHVAKSWYSLIVDGSCTVVSGGGESCCTANGGIVKSLC